MAKADIETKTGMKISVEGTSDEVAAIINYVNNKDQSHETKSHFVDEKRKKPAKSELSLVNLIIGLKESGFFNTPQTVVEVKKALERDTHFYPLQSISTALIRRVKKGELGRTKEGKSWTYVKR